MIDITSFYKTYSIAFKTTGSKHCRPGWVQIPCPFCPGNTGWHLGYNQKGGYYHCWRCGGHSEAETIKTILGLTWGAAIELTKALQTGKASLSQHYEEIKKAGKCVLPYGCKPLGHAHKKYLKSRNYKPNQLQKIWGLLGTGPFGDYNFRIIAPIYVNGILVSYQGRDISGKSEIKYKACKQEDEVIDHKHCLYGIDNVPNKNVVVVTEGIADVWRLGPGAVATFGIKFKPAQIIELKKFKRVIALFDSDPQAIEEADKLSEALASFNVEVENIEMADGDPGELSQKEADALMNELMGV